MGYRALETKLGFQEVQSSRPCALERDPGVWKLRKLTPLCALRKIGISKSSKPMSLCAVRKNEFSKSSTPTPPRAPKEPRNLGTSKIHVTARSQQNCDFRNVQKPRLEGNTGVWELRKLAPLCALRKIEISKSL